jgi:hypothetical protein
MQCATDPHTPTSCTSCSYHQYVRSVAASGVADDMPAPHVRRLLTVDPPMVAAAMGGMLRRAGAGIQSAKATEVSEHVARVARFIRLINHLGTAPWANKHFDVNYDMTMRLAASHLSLISPGAPTSLCSIISPDRLEGAQNLCWVTNRQQGKTTTLARFVAALAIASPVGGVLFTVYSTSLDRSIELVKGAKAYIHWMMGTSGAHPDWETLGLLRDNERMFTCTHGYGANRVANTVIGRPKNPESCRGDAPHAAIFDEIGFIGRALWDQFAFPLLQVQGRIFTCATTPPPPNGFFSQFISQVKTRNEEHNDYFFTLINHSLSCSTCLDAGEGTECMHNMAFLPPWKSIVTLNQMMNLVSDRETFQMEVFGVLSDGNEQYIPSKLIEAATARAPVVTPWHPAHVWVAVDPASHGKSDLAMLAFAMTADGVHVIVGMAAVNVAKCQTSEVQLIMHQFLSRIRESPLIGKSTVLIPIIECNNNEILSMSILRTCERYPPVTIPWTEEHFERGISPGIGIWMTHDTKMAGVQSTYQAFLDGRITFARDMVIADRTAFHARARPATREQLMKILCAQLKAFSDQPDGTVSGKHLGNDDLACAMIIGIYWSACARALF